MKITDQPDSSAESAALSPIVLGVSGHLDPRSEDIGPIKKTLEAIFSWLEEWYPHTPILLMSSLARGADQLAVEVALARNIQIGNRTSKIPITIISDNKPHDFRLGGKQRTREIQITAPLPFPASVYANSSTFRDHPDTAQNLKRLLARKDIHSFVVSPFAEIDDEDLEVWKRIVSNLEHRRSCYANSGAYIIRRCHALIAFWDGKPADKDHPSGTAEIVNCKLDGTKPVLSLLDWPLLTGGEKGPVFVIHTPREKGSAEEIASVEEPSSRAPKAGDLRILVPAAEQDADFQSNQHQELPADLVFRKPSRFWHRVSEALGLRAVLGLRRRNSPKIEWEQFQEVCKSTDNFNRDVQENAGVIRSRLQTVSKSWIWREAESDTLPRVIHRLLAIRESAGALATRLGKISTFWTRTLWVVLLLAGVSFDFYAHWPWPPELDWGRLLHSWTILLFMIFLVLAGATVVWVWLWRFSERQLDYRALAEALRIRVIWASAGIGESVADTYLSQMRSEMSWTRRALQIASPLPVAWHRSFQRLRPEIQQERFRNVLDHWVSEQKVWFSKRTEQRHIGAGKLRFCGFSVAVVGWVLALILVCVFGPFARGTKPKEKLERAHSIWSPSADKPKSDKPKTSAAQDTTASPIVKSPDREDASPSASRIASPAEKANIKPDATLVDRPNVNASAISSTNSTQTDAEEARRQEEIRDGLLLGSGILVLSGGLLVAYCERRSHDELAKQYERMTKIFTQGERAIKEHMNSETVDLPKVQAVLTALGREAIMENAQWLILRRNRPFELPIQ